jgi:hypothetical protein
MDYGFRWNPFADGSKIRFQSLVRNSFVEMSGEAFHGITLFGFFMELVNNISEQATPRGKNAIGHVSRKLSLRFRKIF